MERHRAGDEVADYCRFCGGERSHVVSIADGDGRILRVVCDGCRSEHPFNRETRPVAPRPAAPPLRGEPTRVGHGSGHATPGLERAPFPAVSERERSHPPMSVDSQGENDLELMLRRVIREEGGLTPVVPADRWRGGELVLRPGKEGLQDKSWPIEAFFHKVVMIRNRLRVLEQQVNGADEIPQAVKLKLQAYITACYGSLTSFNVLFADPEEQFRGSGGKE